MPAVAALALGPFSCAGALSCWDGFAGDCGGSSKPVGEGPASILTAVRRQEEERQKVEETVGQLAKHLKEGR